MFDILSQKIAQNIKHVWYAQTGWIHILKLKKKLEPVSIKHYAIFCEISTQICRLALTFVN